MLALYSATLPMLWHVALYMAVTISMLRQDNAASCASLSTQQQ